MQAMGEARDGRPEQNIALYAAIVLYLLVLVVVAAVAYRRKRAAASTSGVLEAHFGGSFNAPLLILTTFSTVYSGFTVTGIPSEAYHRGFISLRWVGATLVIVAAMLLFYPRLRRLAVERKYRSPNDFITDRFRSLRLRLLCAACAVVPLLIYITAQTVSFAAMVSGLTLQVIPKWASMASFAAVTLALEKLGGMNSVVLTDAVQSLVMIGAFMLVPWVLGADFGFLPRIAAPDCPSLTLVSRSTASIDAPPAACFLGPDTASPTGPECVPAGCIAAVRPEFYQYPSQADQASILWFFVNMLAAALQPHMIQRAYIAASDRALKVVMVAMLVAPFLAQPPGIVIGLTRAAFEPAWPEVERNSTAFSAVSDELMAKGTFEYVLVTVMTCSTMAAIMSTADSALMGASSVVSIDIFKGSLAPSASKERLVQVGEINSFLMVVAAVFLGLNLSVSQFGSLIVFQNGMLMQLLPTFGLGLYFHISECSLTCGITSGLVVLAALAALGNPLDPFIPMVNVSFIANFLTVAIVHAVVVLRGVKEERQEGVAHEVGVPFHEQSCLTIEDIRALMAPSREPSKAILSLMLALALMAVPWYRPPGSREQIILGLPLWGFIQCLIFVAIFALGQLATVLWTPKGLDSGEVSEEEESKNYADGSCDSNTSSSGTSG